MQKCFPINIRDAYFEPVLGVPNSQGTKKVIQIIAPEFSSVCPKTGLPDFGRVVLRYVPDQLCVELKAWKMFLMSFYGVGTFHEDATQRIADEFTRAIAPRWCNIAIDWSARGGVHTCTQLTWTRDKGYISYPEHWENPLFMKAAEEWQNR